MKGLFVYNYIIKGLFVFIPLCTVYIIMQILFFFLLCGNNVMQSDRNSFKKDTFTLLN